MLVGRIVGALGVGGSTTVAMITISTVGVISVQNTDNSALAIIDVTPWCAT